MSHKALFFAALLCAALCQISYAQDGAFQGLYKDKANPLKSITPDAVQQGSVGDCVLLALISSLAGSDPEAIQEMIRTNADGSYTVTFPGAPDEPVTVQLEPGDVFFAQNRSGDWVTVLEKAYGTYCSKSFRRREPTSIFRTDPNAKAAEGTSASLAFQLLTGGDVESHTLGLTSYASLDRALRDSMHDGKAVIVGNNAIAGDLKFPTGHAYTVLKYQPNTGDPKNGLVTVRNPWAQDWSESARAKTKGSASVYKEMSGRFPYGSSYVSTLTLEQFSKEFSKLCCATARPPHTVTIPPVIPQKVHPIGPSSIAWDPRALIYYDPNERVPHPTNQVPGSSSVATPSNGVAAQPHKNPTTIERGRESGAIGGRTVKYDGHRLNLSLAPGESIILEFPDDAVYLVGKPSPSGDYIKLTILQSDTVEYPGIARPVPKVRRVLITALPTATKNSTVIPIGCGNYEQHTLPMGKSFSIFRPDIFKSSFVTIETIVGTQ